jgi:hypothetical protein
MPSEREKSQNVCLFHSRSSKDNTSEVLIECSMRQFFQKPNSRYMITAIFNELS